MFLATALSPNRDIVVIAIGVGSIEDGEHWTWFLKLIQQGLDIEGQVDVVMMSDREKRLDAAMREVYPTIPHGFCSVHIKKNVISNYRSDYKGRVNTLAKCLTEADYNKVMEKCKEIHEEAADYLKGSFCILYLFCLLYTLANQ